MSSMQVILLRNIPNLGSFGDVVKVKRGHARNHLLPTGKVKTYTKENFAEFETRKQEIIKEQEKLQLSLRKLHSELDGYLLQTVMQASEEGQLYGSISPSVVVDLLKEQNHEIKRNQVTLPGGQAIKSIGDYEVEIKISDELVAMLKFSVVSDRTAR